MQMAISHEMGRLALMNQGQLNVPFPEVLLQVLKASTFGPSFSIHWDRIELPKEPLPLKWDMPLGSLWWTWEENQTVGVAEWWKHPDLPQVCLFQFYYLALALLT